MKINWFRAVTRPTVQEQLQHCQAKIRNQRQELKQKDRIAGIYLKVSRQVSELAVELQHKQHDVNLLMTEARRCAKSGDSLRLVALFSEEKEEK